MHSSQILVAVPCGIAVGYQCFRGRCCLHFQGKWMVLDMKMEAVRSSEMLVSTTTVH